jgi:hypothetical protein
MLIVARGLAPNVMYGASSFRPYCSGRRVADTSFTAYCISAGST